MDAKERSGADVTALLLAWRGGDIDARDRLATVVYQELRRRAGAYLRRERVGQLRETPEFIRLTADLEHKYTR